MKWAAAVALVASVQVNAEEIIQVAAKGKKAVRQVTVRVHAKTGAVEFKQANRWVKARTATAELEMQEQEQTAEVETALPIEQAQYTYGDNSVYNYGQDRYNQHYGYDSRGYGYGNRSSNYRQGGYDSGSSYNYGNTYDYNYGTPSYDYNNNTSYYYGSYYSPSYTTRRNSYYYYSPTSTLYFAGQAISALFNRSNTYGYNYYTYRW